MKRNIFPLIILFALISSCEKPIEKGEAGNPLVRYYGDAREDIGYSIAETSDGYIICGKLTIITRSVEDGVSRIESENPNFGLIKTDRKGIQLWSYNSGGEWFDEGRKVLVMDDGSFVCVGTTTVGAAGTTNTDVLVTRISSSGDLVWERTYGNLFNQRGYDIVHDPGSGGFFVVGSTDDYSNGLNSPGKLDMLMFSITSAGDLIETYSTGTETNEYAKRVVAFDNKYYVIGETEGTHPYLTGGDQKTNIMIVPAEFSNFVGKDFKIYGTGEAEKVSDVVSLGSELVIVGTVGETDSKEGLFVKIGPGTLEEQYGFEYFDLSSNVVELNSVTIIYGVGLLVCGNTGGTDLSGDMLFMFLDNDGNNIQSPGTYITGGTGLQSANDAIIDSEGKVVAVGLNRYENNSLITLLKFDPWQ